MASSQDFDKLSVGFYIAGIFFLTLNIYYFCIGIFMAHGLTTPVVTDLMLKFSKAGLFRTTYTTKLYGIVCMAVGCLFRVSKRTEQSNLYIAAVIATGTILYVLPFFRTHGPAGTRLYMATTVVGFFVLSYGLTFLARRREELEDEDLLNDPEETFMQCGKLMENKYSINLETRYKYLGEMHRGYINIVAPFRGIMVTGGPGAGKSYSFFEPAIAQAISKNYSVCCYDFKFPDLSTVVYNEYLKKYKDCDKRPGFGVINFKDPRYTHRCNPLQPQFIESLADSNQIALTFMDNANKMAKDKQDFFSESAKEYFSLDIALLKTIDGGKYCTLPHALEVMAADYKKVFEIMKSYKELDAKLSVFNNALESNAQDQLQGQIASAQIPLNKFISKELYWVLSPEEGEGLRLDINNPKHPTMLCIGNDPKHQEIFGATIALMLAQLFKKINTKGMNPSMVILDELPTIYLPDVPNLINTGRSNKVCVCCGIQEKNQLVKEYTQDGARVILNAVGTRLCGSVSYETAQDEARTFGKIFRKQSSVSHGDDSDNVSVSYHEVDVLSANKIENFSSGTFCGKVADLFGQKIKNKFFCGEIVRDPNVVEAEKATWQELPMIDDFDLEGITAHVDENIDEYTWKWCEDKVKNENPDGSTLQIHDLTVTMQRSLDDNQVAEIRSAAIDHEWDNHIKEVVEENYKRIKREVKELIDREYSRVIAEKGKKALENKEIRTDTIIKRHDDIISRKARLMQKGAEARQQDEQNQNNNKS